LLFACSSIYTSNLTEPLESIGLRHALEIAGDKKIAKAWNDCFAALHLVLDRHVPGYDFDRI